MTDDAPLDRRRFLKYVGTSAVATGLAGCEDTQPTYTGADPEITLSNVRLVQFVENTHVENGSYSEPDPDLVAGENAAVAFDLSVTGPNKLPDRVGVAVTLTNGGGLRSFHLTRDDVRRIDGGTDALAVLHGNARDGDHNTDPPVFEVLSGLSEVSVEVAPLNPNVVSREVTLTEGANADFRVRTVPRLRVGFMPLWDRDDGDNYGDGDGETTGYRETVDRAVRYMRRVYPGEITAYREPNQVVLGKAASGETYVKDDFKNAKTFCESSLANSAISKSVRSGYIVHHEAGSDLDALNDLLNHGFDAVVCVVPGDYSSNSAGTDYFDFHYSLPSGRFYLGMAFDAKRAVGAMETGDARISPVSASVTTAQEVGHLLADEPYDGPASGGRNHPLAQRDGTSSIDEDHARDTQRDWDGDGTVEDNLGVESTAFDLTGGTFTLVNGWGFDASGNLEATTSTAPTGPDGMASFMSYFDDDSQCWTDARILQFLVDGQYQPGYSGGPRQVLSATGEVEGGEVAFGEVRAYTGYPVPGESFDEPADDVATVEFVDPAGEVLHAEQVRTTIEQSHAPEPIEGVVSVVAPFPATTVAVRTVVAGEETRLNPIVGSVRDALGRLDEAASDDPGAFREFASGLLDEVAALMRGGEYLAAADAMREVGELAESELRATETRFANVATRADLVDLVEQMVERLETVAEAAR